MTNPLEGMTQAKWASERDSIRDNSELSPQLTGLEGHRVEVRDEAGGKLRRFIVGKSTGWRPCHLEIARTNSMGGGVARKHYASIMDLGKVR